MQVTENPTQKRERTIWNNLKLIGRLALTVVYLKAQILSPGVYLVDFLFGPVVLDASSFKLTSLQRPVQRQNQSAPASSLGSEFLCPDRLPWVIFPSQLWPRGTECPGWLSLGQMFHPQSLVAKCFPSLKWPRMEKTWFLKARRGRYGSERQKHIPWLWIRN